MPTINVDTRTQALAWDAGAGGGTVDSYQVFAGASLKATVDGTVFSVPLSSLGLADNQTINLSVRALNSGGSAASAVLAIFTVPPVSPPAAPVNIRIL